MALAVAGISRARWLRWPARVYTDIFRGLPEVVIILLIGLGVGPLVGAVTGNNPYPLGIAALGLMAAAYVGEIFRSGIQSVEPGQLEAARALGFSYRSSMRLVVVPQGIRRVLPALVNQFISLLKASALVYFLGLVAGQRELFQVGRDLNAQTGNLSPLVAAGLFYLALTIPLTHSGELHRPPAPAGPGASGAGRSAGTPTAGDGVTMAELTRRELTRPEPVSLSGRGIHLSFGGNAVLRGVDIDVAAGRTVAVIGPSGSGKSTLLRTLNRLYEPDEGDILLDGRSVLEDNPDALRQRIGWCSRTSTCSRTAA